MVCNSSPVSCNRQPFLTDSSCDRGNVDIHQFDDLPFCDPINPTVPDIPPEVVDTPLNLPIPPACACIHVDYDIGFKYTKEREFSASTSFSAKSDCCEGLYVSRINLQVPCPVISSSRNYRLRVVARYGKSSASPTSYFETDNSSCTFRPLSATLNVNVPCPVSSAGPYRLQVKAKYGKGSASPTSYFVNDPSSCVIRPLSATLNVNVPCPVSSAGPYRLQVKAKYGKGSASPTSYFVTNPDSCTINPLSATLKVNVPCPVSSAGPYKLRVKAKYSKDSAPSVSYFKTNPDSCTISPLSATLRVNIPCPIISSSGPYKLRIVAKYGSSAASSVSYMRTDNDRCIIKPYSAMLKVNVPCPLPQDKKPYTIRAKAKYSKDDASSVSYLKTGGSSCTINPLSPTIQVNVPCPVSSAGPYRLQVKARYGKGSASPTSYFVNDPSSCVIRPLSTTLNVNVPCPIAHESSSSEAAKRRYKFRVRARYAKGLAPAASYLEVDDMSCVINPLATFASSGMSYSWMDPEFPDGFLEPHTVAMNVNIRCPVRSRRRILGKLSEAEEKYPGEIKISGDTKFRYQKFTSKRTIDPSTGIISPWSDWECTASEVGSVELSFDNEEWTAKANGRVFMKFDDDGNPTSFTESKEQETTYQKTKEVYQVSENKGAWLDSENATLEDMPYLYFDTDIEQNANLPNGISVKKKIGNNTTLLGNSELFFQRDGDTITAYDNGGSTLGNPVATFTLDKDGRFHASGGSFDIDGDSASNATLIAFDSGDSAKIEEGGKMFVGVAYGNGPNGRAAKFVQTDESNCSTQFLSPVFNLSIPCPMKVLHVRNSSSDSSSSSTYITKGAIKIIPVTNFYIPYESSTSSSSSGTTIGWVKHDCEVVLKDKTILNIPPMPSPFFMDGHRIRYRYMIVGRTMIHQDTSDSLGCLSEPDEGLMIYAKVSISNCNWSLEVKCGYELPDNTLSNTYRMLYIYRDGRWVDCRWMPTIVAMDY